MTYQLSRALVLASDSGIGRATAVALAALGADVGITWHADQDGAEKTAAEVRAHGRSAEIAQVDTSDLASCGDAVDELIDRLGGVDAFVYVAGTGTTTLALDMKLDEWREGVAPHLDGAVVTPQRAPPRVIEGGQGGPAGARTGGPQ